MTPHGPWKICHQLFLIGFFFVWFEAWAEASHQWHLWWRAMGLTRLAHGGCMSMSCPNAPLGSRTPLLWTPDVLWIDVFPVSPSRPSPATVEWKQVLNVMKRVRSAVRRSWAASTLSNGWKGAWWFVNLEASGMNLGDFWDFNPWLCWSWICQVAGNFPGKQYNIWCNLWFKSRRVLHCLVVTW